MAIVPYMSGEGVLNRKWMLAEFIVIEVLNTLSSVNNHKLLVDYNIFGQWKTMMQTKRENNMYLLRASPADTSR